MDYTFDGAALRLFSYQVENVLHRFTVTLSYPLTLASSAIDMYVVADLLQGITTDDLTVRYREVSTPCS